MMRSCQILLLAILCALAVLALSGCASTEEGSTVNGGVYYGTSFHDPWYHYDYYYPPDVVVTPPPVAPPRPTQPIYTPTPRPTPMPSVPMTPRFR